MDNRKEKKLHEQANKKPGEYNIPDKNKNAESKDKLQEEIWQQLKMPSLWPTYREPRSCAKRMPSPTPE